MSDLRYEYKYLLDSKQDKVLSMRMYGTLQRDKHVSDNGTYEIRSLYFDTPNNKCFFENENGIDPRSKYRIRIYDSDLSYISLEKKSKINGLTLKESCMLDEYECKSLMDVDASILKRIVKNGLSQDDRMKVKLITEMFENMLIPKVIVSYEREPYVFPAGNVRVTFDRNISSSNELNLFLNKKINSRPIFSIGKSLMEVKWDGFIPVHIKNILQTDNLKWTNFSKYYLCRKYGMDGGILQ